MRVSRRGGFSLPELLVVMMLLGIVGGAMITVLARQQRFYRSANDMVESRTQVRQAVDLLPVDLRGISAGDTRNGTDFYVATDKALEFRAITGSSVLCRITTSTKIVIPPSDLARGNALTAWESKPVVGDSVLVFDDSLAVGPEDDHWSVHRVTNIGQVSSNAANACNTASGFVTDADVTAGQVSYAITLSPALSVSVDPGAPVRFFRPRRYELYQPSASSGWYLGTYDCLAACDALTPLSGPFAVYSATVANSGLSFTYYDSLGVLFSPAATTADRSRIARVRLIARADTRGAVNMPGRARAVRRDSLTVDIALRNRK